MESNGALEGLLVPEENHEVKDVLVAVDPAAVAEEENHEVEGLATAEEENQGVEGLAGAVPEAPVEKGHPELIIGFAGAVARRGRCKGFCGKPETEDITEIASRALRFVGNFANAFDAALPIAAPRLLGFANISPMVLGLSFVVLMV